jgi:response regulator of citrate/malate metabolism
MEWLKRNWIWVLGLLVAVIAAVVILKPNPDRQLRKELERYRKEQAGIHRKAQEKIDELLKDRETLIQQLQEFKRMDSIEDRNRIWETQKGVRCFGLQRS